MAKPPQNLALCTTRENLSAPSSLIPRNPSVILSASSRYSPSDCCPTESSGVPGPGYLTGKAMKWLGQVSLRGLQEAVLLARLWRYNRLVTAWRTQNNLIMCVENETEIYNVLGDMLELSKYVSQEHLSLPDAVIFVAVVTTQKGFKLELSKHWIKYLLAAPFHLVLYKFQSGYASSSPSCELTLSPPGAS